MQAPIPVETAVDSAAPTPARFDYLVVGAGFAGAVCAERLAAAGRRVLVVDRRPHIGGNAYDEHDETGLLVHRYGPHIFHTNSDGVFAYLSRFTEWRAYEHRVLASVDNMLVPIPINLDTINAIYGLELAEGEVEPFLATLAEPVAQVRTSEEVVVSRVGRELYEKIFRGYTRKQWGLDPSELDASVAARIPVRTNRDDRYFTDRFQAMPAAGYTEMFRRMLGHPAITVRTGVDWRSLDGVSYGEIIFTGPVDEFFEHRYEPLPYRSLEFEFETLDVELAQPVGTVNYPNEHAYTRQTEFKHLTGQVHPATTVVREYPRADGDPYYPVPRPETKALYERYRALAEATPGVHFVGRLATYKYYNMDQVVAQALTVAARLVADTEAAVAGDRTAVTPSLPSPAAAAVSLRGGRTRSRPLVPDEV
ncbi:MAG: UDP-galactopyranose mutase [Chloroflexota bacterium]|nr:UDP-galactopyranose mutase [Chloroflexota bacterium]